MGSAAHQEAGERQSLFAGDFQVSLVESRDSLLVQRRINFWVLCSTDPAALPVYQALRTLSI